MLVQREPEVLPRAAPPVRVYLQSFEVVVRAQSHTAGPVCGSLVERLSHAIDASDHINQSSSTRKSASKLDRTDQTDS